MVRIHQKPPKGATDLGMSVKDTGAGGLGDVYERMPEHFYLGIVKSILIFGSEIWVATPTLEGYWGCSATGWNYRLRGRNHVNKPM